MKSILFRHPSPSISNTASSTTTTKMLLRTDARRTRDALAERSFMIVPKTDFIRLMLRAADLHGRSIRLPDPLAETAEYEVAR